VVSLFEAAVSVSHTVRVDGFDQRLAFLTRMQREAKTTIPAPRQFHGQHLNTQKSVYSRQIRAARRACQLIYCRCQKF
jgi:hypothetical protein